MKFSFTMPDEDILEWIEIWGHPNPTKEQLQVFTEGLEEYAAYTMAKDMSECGDTWKDSWLDDIAKAGCAEVNGN